MSAVCLSAKRQSLRRMRSASSTFLSRRSLEDGKSRRAVYRQKRTAGRKNTGSIPEICRSATSGRWRNWNPWTGKTDRRRNLPSIRTDRCSRILRTMRLPFPCIPAENRRAYRNPLLRKKRSANRRLRKNRRSNSSRSFICRLYHIRRKRSRISRTAWLLMMCLHPRRSRRKKILKKRVRAEKNLRRLRKRLRHGRPAIFPAAVIPERPAAVPSAAADRPRAAISGAKAMSRTAIPA